MTKNINAVEFLKTHTKKECYDFALDILYSLEKKGYCIWQTYSIEDLETMLDRKPTKDEFSAMQERLANTHDDILLEV